MKSVLLKALFLLLLLTPVCFSQDPLPIIRSAWKATTKKADKVDVPQSGPARQIITDDTMIARTSREFATDHPENPGDQTPDGRRAAIEKNEQEAKVIQPSDVKGFEYSAIVRNASDKTVNVIYWEFIFTELANPANVVRRQFLCSVNLKKGSEIELTAFTTLGPSDTVGTTTLRSPGEKGFDEKARVNRIEYSDDDVPVQRRNWKIADVKAAIDRATATPWGKEICRPL